MSFPPSNDASMMPSPRRGKRNPRFSSPGQQFSPGGQQNSFHQSPYNNRGGQQSPYNNRGGQQSPYNNRGFGTPNRQSGGRGRGRGRGQGCQYGDYQRDVQQFSPNYRSMSGGYGGSSPNCSFDPNLKRRMHPQGNGLYHPSMASDPWEGLSSEDKPMFKAANYISESYLSYCAKLQTKSRERTFENDWKTSTDSTTTPSVSQLAANVSKLYDSFVSSNSDSIPGKIKEQRNDDRPTKIQKN